MVKHLHPVTFFKPGVTPVEGKVKDLRPQPVEDVKPDEAFGDDEPIPFELTDAGRAALTQPAGEAGADPAEGAAGGMAGAARD